MSSRVRKALAIIGWVLPLVAAGALQSWAQTSVGRGAPDPMQPKTIVGPDGRGLFVGPEANPDPYVAIVAARNGAVPDGVQPLPVDIFTTRERTPPCARCSWHRRG